MTGTETVEVEIRALASGGAGVGDLPDGRVVFVPRTAPGDTASIHVVKQKPRWAIGRLVQLTRPGPDRTEPTCAIYDDCGGCALQHVTYDAQLRWKARFVTDALQRIGSLQAETPAVQPCALPFGYRNRLTFTLRRLRDGRIAAGFHALGRPAHVIDVHDQCRLPEPEVASAWRALREGWGAGARRLPRGGRLSLTVRATSEGVALAIEGGEGPWDARELAAAVPSIRAFWHRPTRAEASTLVAGEELQDEWGEDRFGVGGRAFQQVNRLGAAQVRAYVLENAGPGRSVVDAYAGVGLYGRELARHGWTSTCIEIDPEACKAARSGAPEGMNVVEGRVEETLAGVLPASLVILNPPRAGLHSDLPAMLCETPASRLIYVSCDPATLARDLAALGRTYELVDLQAWDLFPQTPHVETAAVLQRREEG